MASFRQIIGAIVPILGKLLTASPAKGGLLDMEKASSRLFLVDHPIVAEGISVVLQNHLNIEVKPAFRDDLQKLPPYSLVLIEIFLPDHQCGLVLARQLQAARADLIPVVWTAHPAPLYLWAALEYKLPGFLDKELPIPELVQWLNHALSSGSAWNGRFLAQAREWEERVGSHLKMLRPAHWLLWGDLLRGWTTPEIAARSGWSARSVARRLDELYNELGVKQRLDAVALAWDSGLIKARAGDLEWSFVVQEFFSPPKTPLSEIPSLHPLP